MMQKSVYSKIALNATSAKSIVNEIARNRPDEGIVEILTVTEKQYQNIEYLVGSPPEDVINSGDRLVIL